MKKQELKQMKKSSMKITFKENADGFKIGALIEVLSNMEITEKIESDIKIKVRKNEKTTT